MYKVYLAGPMMYASTWEMNRWRNEAKVLLGEQNCIDPVQIEVGSRDVVTLDKESILQCTHVLAHCKRPGWGTAMEIFFAWQHKISVVAVVPAILSPWIKHHSNFLVSTVKEGCNLIKEHGNGLSKH